MAVTRRTALRLGLAGIATLAGGGTLAFELVQHGVLPGKALLDEIDGACEVATAQFAFRAPGPQLSGSFYSRARGTTVGYTIAYPPGHGPGSRLPLVVALHGLGGNHANAMSGSPAHWLALRSLPPMAIVTADGGDGYWHRHGRDDPLAMLVDELIPRCRRRGLGERIAATGVSMGGYGALLLAERHPRLISAVSAISPAIWTTYSQAHAANAGAFISPADFAANDVLTHVDALRRTPVRIAAGELDPFISGQRAFARALGPTDVSYIGPGCHTRAFFASQQPPSLEFLAARIYSVQ
jgi:S-formylglutathione hydrolase FrmB